MSASRIFDQFGQIDWHSWLPGEQATLVFVITSGRILLIGKKRGLGMGKITGPGGRLEAGETPAECARREIGEELHVSPGPLNFEGQLWFQFCDGYALLVHIFTATEFSGTPTETEEARPLWADLDRIPYDAMWEDDRYWMPLMLEGKTVLGRFLFDGDAMLGREIMTDPNETHFINAFPQDFPGGP